MYELIRKGIIGISGTCNAGMMVPSFCQVYGTICDQAHIIIIRKIARKLLNRSRFIWKDDKQYEVSLK